MIDIIANPKTKTILNTHTFVESININFSIDGTSYVHMVEVDGYVVSGSFVPDVNSRDIIRVGGLILSGGVEEILTCIRQDSNYKDVKKRK